jgi:hypothetical protein
MNLTPESDLLLACTGHFAGTCGDADVVERARRIEDWSAVIDLARAHWMEPLVAWQLKSICPDLLDPDLSAHLDQMLRFNTAKHLLLSADLIKVLAILEAEQIAAVTLKGPVLAATLCDDIPWRDSCDLDLLVRRADISRAKDALLAAGYRLDSQLPPGEEKAAFHWRSQLVLVRDGISPAIDLHWQLLPSLFPAARHLESVWDRVQPAMFQGRKVLVLSPEDQLVFLCAHAARHSWHSLRLAADIARLIHVRAELDWEGLLESARKSDAGRVLALGLWLANRLLQVKLTAPVLEFVNASIGEKRFARDLLDNLLTTVADQHEAPSDFGLQLRLAPGLWAKIRCAGAFALLPSDSDGALSLPAPLYFLYYLYRPLRLTAKYITKLLRLDSAAQTSSYSSAPNPIPACHLVISTEPGDSGRREINAKRFV